MGALVDRRHPLALVLAHALACAAHAAVLVALGPAEAPVPAASGQEEAPTIDLDMTEPPTAQAVPLAAPSDERADKDDPEARRDAPIGATAAKTARTESSIAPTEKATTSGDDLSPAEPPPGEWSFAPSRPASSASTRIDLHAAITPDMVAPPPGSDGGDGPRRSTTGGVAEALAEQDTKTGMGRGGSVLAAAELAARGSDAPLDGDATFEVVVHAGGAVTARVVQATGDEAAWTRVADSLGRSVDAKRVRIPPGARGWRVVVHVEAKVQLADGRDVRTLHGWRAGVAPSVLQKVVEGTASASDAPTTPTGADPAGGGPTNAPPPGSALGGRKQVSSGAGVAQGLAQAVAPMPTLSVSGKICSLTVALTPLGVGMSGGCSLENIGTGTSRHVSGRIVREGAL